MTVWSARLSWRSPPRLSRCRVVWPEEAGIGATPASRAKAASERTRPLWDQLTISWAATIGPTPGSSSNPGASARTWARISCSAPPLPRSRLDPAGEGAQHERRGELVGGTELERRRRLQRSRSRSPIALGAPGGAGRGRSRSRCAAERAPRGEHRRHYGERAIGAEALPVVDLPSAGERVPVSVARAARIASRPSSLPCSRRSLRGLRPASSTLSPRPLR